MKKLTAFHNTLLSGIMALAFSSTLALAQDNTAAANNPSTAVAKKVRHELVMMPYVTIFDNLSYRVDGNTVTLYGKVTRPVLKDDAGRLVSRIEGVEHVDNQIEVLPLSPFDNQIRRATARYLWISDAQSLWLGHAAIHPDHCREWARDLGRYRQ